MNKTRGIKNIIIGLASKILMFAIGIIIPRLVLINLGSEANGLLNSVTTAMTYMSLLEAGVGIASLQALYNPFANGDKSRINEILAATDRFYRKTGLVYFICVVVLSIGYPLLIKTEIPKWQVILVVLLTGLTGVLSYLFQGKFKILLSAEGKNYITTTIVTGMNVCINVSKAVLLVLGQNVVVIQFSYFIFNLLQTLIYYIYIKKHYPWLDLNVKPNYDAISQKNAALVHQVSSMIFSNTDVLVLSIATSLKEVSVYSLYVLIYGLVSSIGETMYESYRYALGQTFHSNRDRFMRLFNTYEVYIFIVSFSLFTITRLMINPFLTLYTTGVEDITYADKYLPWLFAAYYIMNNGRVSSSAVISIAERFEETKWRSILESVINLTVSIIAVQWLGIYGVLIGTITALLYRTNDMIIYASRILNRSCLITYKRWIANIIAFVFISLLLLHVQISKDSYFILALQAGLIGLGVGMFYLLVNWIFDRSTVMYGLSIINNLFQKRLGKLRQHG